MHVILTGKRQVGKSTMCRRITEAVKKEGHSVGGVWTETIMHAEERTLMVHNLDGGESTLLASTARQGPGPKQGNFVFSYEGIFAGIRAIGNAMKHDLLPVGRGHAHIETAVARPEASSNLKPLDQSLKRNVDTDGT